ncbi:MAG: bacillithiol biosynthesis deacetylase BshB1 [Flavobacteriales bacterium]|nr:bacillithiol biosynthesis deacetylase BshB1 [Flavobacteriales bacterium]
MKLDILVFAAHPDDAELACSGTLLHHIAMGYKVGIVDLSRGELGTRGSAELRKKEAEESSKILGIHARENLQLPDGFIGDSADNRLKVIDAIRKYKPELVLANALSDRHIDHGHAAELVHNAAFLSGLIKIVTSYEAHRPRKVLHYIQDQYMKPDVVVDITPYFDQKMKAIMAFSSQFYNPDSNEPNTPISGSDFIEYLEARSREMGRLIGVTYGEGFVSDTAIKSTDLTKI